MTDPFEESKNPSLPALPSSQLRERSVQQAVDFLNDPRVRTAHPGKALEFLRQKGITDEELREAYQRCNLPFPNTMLGPQFMTPQNPVPQQYPQYQQPPRTSWVSVFLGITAAAGLYTAVREVLRRYIVPLYFPDAARIADERRRREEHTFQAQERQIAELRERIQDLVTSSDRTTDRMERLSKSLSSSIALRERELSETSQLRSAIQQLSQTVSMSTGTASRGMQASSSRPKDESFFRDQNVSNKQDSRRFPGVVETSGVRRSVDMNTDETEGDGTGHLHDGHNVNGGQASGVNGYVASSITERGEGKPDEEDDFLAIQPAEVEESWKKGIGNACDSSTSARSTSKDEKEVSAQKPSENVDRATFYEPVTDSEITEGGLITSGATALPADENEIGVSVVDPSRGAAASAVARQLFRFEMMREATNVLSKDAEDSEHSARLRPNSMPQMDTPLSDLDA